MHVSNDNDAISINFIIKDMKEEILQIKETRIPVTSIKKKKVQCPSEG